METIWIIGAGKFGQLAAKRVQHKFKIFMVDSNGHNLSKTDDSNITHVHADGIKFLEQHLAPNTDIAWIIPCVSVHLAWEWCRLKPRLNKSDPNKSGPNKIKPIKIKPNKIKLDRLIPQTFPKALNTLLPNPMQGKNTDIYVSHATFLCPDNCSEPDIFCTKTKQPRKQPMHELLESINFKDYKSFVLKSQQIAPGVGGYRPKELVDFKNKIKHQKGNLLISTACRCHGVITGAKHITCE